MYKLRVLIQGEKTKFGEKVFLVRILLVVIFFPCIFNIVSSDQWMLPEIYQDVLIQGQVTIPGIRDCHNRYMGIYNILSSLPRKFKLLDIGASQGYFSFKLAEDFQARCTMIEDGYTISNFIWNTASYLKYLCEQNSHLCNLTLLQKKVTTSDLIRLRELEEFDIVLAFSVIHHMKVRPDQPNTVYLEVINAVLNLSPVVLVENPVNTGEHTYYIREILQKKNGKLIYQCYRDNLLYETYLFDKRKFDINPHFLPNISSTTYKLFNGVYTNIENIFEEEVEG